MRNNDNNSRRGPRTPSGGRPGSSGAGRGGKPRAGGGFKARGTGFTSDRRDGFASDRRDGFSSDRRPYEARTGRGPRRSFEQGQGEYRGLERSTGRGTGGYRNSDSDASGAGRFGERRTSSEWTTGGYRVTKKRTGKSKKPWEHEEQGTGEFRSSGRDRDQRSEGFRSPSRSAEPRTGGFRGPGRSAEPRTDGYRGSGRSAEPRTDGYRGPGRSAEPRTGGFRGPGRSTEPRTGGFRGPGRSAEPRTGGYRDSRKSFEKPAGKYTGRKLDNQMPKMDAFKKQEAEIDNTEAENEEEDYRIEGRNPVFEALRSGRPLNKLFVEKDKDDTMISRIIAMAREKDIPIQYLDKHKLDSLSQTRIHQGVILEVAAKEYVEVEDILEIAAQKGEKPFVLVLDGITDTNNLGSIIRSAECAGVHGIILPKRRSATLNTTVAKVAAGAMEYVPVARITNLVQTLRELKEQGLWIVGADMEGESVYYDADLKGPCALVIGSEGEGLARLVKNECDLMVKIPMKGKISSLNAGVAAALIMFEITKQRG